MTVRVDGLPSATTINTTPVPIVLGSDPTSVSIAFKLPANQARNFSWPILTAVLLPLFLTRRRRRGTSLLYAGSIAALLSLQGCGGGYLGTANVSAQSTSTTYPVTVTATCRGVTGQPLVHTVGFTVVVQP